MKKDSNGQPLYVGDLIKADLPNLSYSDVIYRVINIDRFGITEDDPRDKTIFYWAYDTDGAIYGLSSEGFTKIEQGIIL